MCVFFQPKSLHACAPTVPPPSSAMLKAIREASLKTKNPAEAVQKTKTHRLNSALSLKKEPQGHHPNWTNNVHSSYVSPVYGINYPQRSTDHDKNNNWPQSSGISNITTIAALEAHGEPGVGSIRDKVVTLKEALRQATERQATAKQAIPAAVKRFQEAKMLLSKLERKRLVAEDKVAKFEEKIHHQEGRLENKCRAMSENWQVNHKIEQKKSEDLRNLRNIEYEMTEMKAAREASLKRVHEATRKVVIVQSALQNAEDRYRELNARRRTLQDMLEMYQKRMKDLRILSREKAAIVEKKSLRKNLLEDHIADSNDRFKRAERRLLPLKIYINQLHESIEDAWKETNHARILLTNYKQRLKGQKYTYYPYDK